MDVYMQALKEFAKKEIYDLDDKDVLDFSCTKTLMIQEEQLYTTMPAQM